MEAASKTGKVLLITEDNKEGSIISEVSAIIAENCLFDLDAPIMRLAGPDVPAMPYSPSLEKSFMVNPEKWKRHCGTWLPIKWSAWRNEPFASVKIAVNWD